MELFRKVKVTQMVEILSSKPTAPQADDSGEPASDRIQGLNYFFLHGRSQKDRSEKSLLEKDRDNPSDFALMQPYASPTGYGLGKSGWVTARFAPKDKVPVPLMGAWLRESYLAVAPKKLAAVLRGRDG